MTWEEALAELGITTAESKQQIRRAYLRRLKSRKPEVDPEGFTRLREAYEFAAAILEEGAVYAAPSVAIETSDSGAWPSPAASEGPTHSHEERLKEASAEDGGALSIDPDQWHQLLAACEDAEQSEDGSRLEESSRALVELSRRVVFRELGDALSLIATLQNAANRLFARERPAAAARLVNDLESLLDEQGLGVALTRAPDLVTHGAWLQEMAQMANALPPEVLSILARNLFVSDGESLAAELRDYQLRDPVKADQAAHSMVGTRILGPNLSPLLFYRPITRRTFGREDGRLPSYLIRLVCFATVIWLIFQSGSESTSCRKANPGVLGVAERAVARHCSRLYRPGEPDYCVSARGAYTLLFDGRCSEIPHLLEDIELSFGTSPDRRPERLHSAIQTAYESHCARLDATPEPPTTPSARDPARLRR